jgi:phospholipid-binding lipoprotein MlaA
VARPSRLCLLLPVLATLALVSGCHPRPTGVEVHDPFESTNRAWFEANLALEQAILPRAAEPEDGPPQPTPLRDAIRNVAANLSTPRWVVNDLLQGRPDRGIENTLRFAINTTVGLGGLLDPAGAMGLHGRPNDFGATLHVWGVNEGAYKVLPIFGPSTERDAAGMVVDTLLDPLDFVLNRNERSAAFVLRQAGRVAERIEYDDILDATVIQSADPYAQARLLYLQNRRHFLGVDSEEDFIDPYADLFD